MSNIVWSNDRCKLSALIPWPRNPRKIEGAQVRRLQESFEEFGQPEVIAISPSNEVYNGHQRLKSWMQKFGDIEVDVRVSSRALTEKEREKLTVLLHKGATGEWDFAALADGFELAELVEWGFDEGELGIETAPAEPTDAEPQVDRAEELRQKWQVEPGDLWRVGEHRLICGDCTDASVVGRVMGGEKAGAVVTDSPYGMNVDGVENDSEGGLDSLFEGVLSALPMTDGVCVNFQGARLFWKWMDATKRHGHTFERALWLYKPNDGTYPWRGWLQTGQLVLISSIGNPVWGKGEYKHDTYQLNYVGDKLEKMHATPKPVEVVTHIVSWVSSSGGIVYDPFSGSGTAIIACEQLGRRCRAVEISPGYVAVALERMAAAFPGIVIERVGE